MKKHKKALFIIGCLLIISIFIAIAFLQTGMLDSGNDVKGNNLCVYFYERNIINVGYENLLEGVKEKDENYDNESTIAQQTTGNVSIVFQQGEDKLGSVINQYVIGYEFVKKNEKYYYSGEKKILIDANKEGNQFLWDDTVKSDLSYSTRKSYKKMNDIGERYDVLPAWGVCDYANMLDVTIDNQQVDNVISIDINNEKYSLWMIDDLKTENNAKKIVIEDKNS